MESFLVGGKKLSELRVVDLRQELEKRGLEKSGVKAVLIERLQKALLEDEPNDVEDQSADANSEEKLLEEDVPEENNDSILSPASKTRQTVKRSPPKKIAEEQRDNEEGNGIGDLEQGDFEVENSFELEAVDDSKEVLDVNKMPDIFDSSPSKKEAGTEDDKEEEKKDDEKEEPEFESLHVKEEISGDDTKAETPKEQEIKQVKEEKNSSEADNSRDNSLSVSLFVHTDEFQDDLDDDLKEAEKKAAEKKAAEKDNQATDSQMEESIEKEAEDSEVKVKVEPQEKEEAAEKMEVVESEKTEETPKKSATTKAAKTQEGTKKAEPKKKTVTEKKGTRSSSSATKDKKETGKSLWVSNLSSVTRAADLKTRFSQYGKVVGAKIVTNSKAPGAQCFGLVTMSTSEEAAKCISHLHRTELHGKTITVDRAKGDRIPSTQSQGTPAKKQPDKKDSTAKGKEKTSKAKAEEKKQPEKGKKPADSKSSSAKSTSKTTQKSAQRPGNKTSPRSQKSGSVSSSGKKGDDKVASDKSKGDAATTKNSEKEKEDKSKDSDKNRSSSQAKSESSSKDERSRDKIKSLEEIRKERQERTRQDNAKRIREQRERERQDRLRRERERVEQERALERARERERDRERERRRQQLLREREVRERQERERMRLQRELDRQKELERQRERERILRERREREERDRIERERRERERIERDRLDRLERDRLQRVERERAQRQRIENERLERERVERERLDRERLDRERLDRERLAQRDHMERERRSMKRPAPPIERGGASDRTAGFWQDPKRAAVGEPRSREFFGGGISERSPRRSDDRRERFHRDESREVGARERDVRGQRTDEFSRVDERRPNKSEHRGRSDSERERGGRDKPLRDHDRDGRSVREVRDRERELRDSRGHQAAKPWLEDGGRGSGLGSSLDSQKSLSILLERAGVSGILGSSGVQGSVGKPSDLAVQSLAHRGETWRRTDPRDSRAPASNVYASAPVSELHQAPESRYSSLALEPSHRGAGLPSSEHEKGGRHWRSAQRGAELTSRERELLVTREREQRGADPKAGSRDVHPYDSRDTRPPARDAAAARGTWGSALDSRQSANPALALSAGRQSSRGGVSVGGRDHGLGSWPPGVSSLATPVNRSYDAAPAPGPDRRHVGAADVRYDPYKAPPSRGGVMRRY